MKDKEVNVYVNTIFKKSGKVQSEDSIVEQVFVARLDEGAAYCNISTSRKATLNMSNYNSAGVEVFISVPCPLEETQMDAAYKFVTDFTESRIKAAIEDLKK